MEAVFYFSPVLLSAEALREAMLAEGTITDWLAIYPNHINLYNGEWFFNVSEMSPTADCFEEPQQVKVAAYRPQSILQISCRSANLPGLLPYLRFILKRYEGWFGLDDGTFNVCYDAANIDELTPEKVCNPIRD